MLFTLSVGRFQVCSHKPPCNPEVSITFTYQIQLGFLKLDHDLSALIAIVFPKKRSWQPKHATDHGHWLVVLSGNIYRKLRPRYCFSHNVFLVNPVNVASTYNQFRDTKVLFSDFSTCMVFSCAPTSPRTTIPNPHDNLGQANLVHQSSSKIFTERHRLWLGNSPWCPSGCSSLQPMWKKSEVLTHIVQNPIANASPTFDAWCFNPSA